MPFRASFAVFACAGGIAVAALPALGQTTVPNAVRICMACHKMAATDKSTIGPNLWRVGGRKAGTLVDYRYSPAMKALAKPWTAERMDAFLADPRTAVPGTKMAYAGQRDAKLRAEIVTYLMRLK